MAVEWGLGVVGAAIKLRQRQRQAAYEVFIAKQSFAHGCPSALVGEGELERVSARILLTCSSASRGR